MEATQARAQTESILPLLQRVMGGERGEQHLKVTEKDDLGDVRLNLGFETPRQVM